MAGKTRGTKPVDLDDVSVDQMRARLVENDAPQETLEQFDEVISRRRFFGLLGKGSAATALLGTGVGAELAFNGLFGRGLIPVAWGEEAKKEEAKKAEAPKEEQPKPIEGKPGMNVLSSVPVNGDFPAHLLGDQTTPPERHFVRNHADVSPRAQAMDKQGWNLTIDGEVNKSLTLTMEDLEKKFEVVTYDLLVECAGNGRAFFDPPVRGNPFGRGAVGCSSWTGVRLRDVLKEAGLKSSAIYTAHYGEDPVAGTESFSRGIPISKAMDDYTLIAFKMGGKDIPAHNGFPVRLVVPGWAGSCSQKWLNKITVRDKVHDSSKMKGFAYRVPRYPRLPGEKGTEEDMQIVTAFGIKSLITGPAEKTNFKAGEAIKVHGHAWAGEGKVKRVMISTDYGATWAKASVDSPRNRFAWYSFSHELKFAEKGYYEIWAQAIDGDGHAQPFVQPWNPGGYMGNMVHRVPIMVA